MLMALKLKEKKYVLNYRLSLNIAYNPARNTGCCFITCVKISIVTRQHTKKNDYFLTQLCREAKSKLDWVQVRGQTGGLIMRDSQRATHVTCIMFFVPVNRLLLVQCLWVGINKFSCYVRWVCEESMTHFICPFQFGVIGLAVEDSPFPNIWSKCSTKSSDDFWAVGLLTVKINDYVFKQ